MPDELYITYQPSTGRYYKRDIVNKKKKWISSDFFPIGQGHPRCGIPGDNGKGRMCPHGI